MQDSVDEDIIEMADEIPYAQLVEFRVKEVELVDHEFAFIVDKKCLELPAEDNLRIVRSFGDLRWLVQKLMKEAPHLLVVPYLEEKSYWNSIRDFTGSLKHNSKSHLRRDEETRFLCALARRHLTLISRVSLQFLYRLGHTRSSLFTFLDDRYQMYKMQVYQKEDGSALGSLTARLGSGTKKIVGYLAGFMGGRPQKLIAYRDRLAKLEERVRAFLEAGRKYEQSLSEIAKNFLNEGPKVEEKELRIFTTLTRTENLNRLLQVVAQEIAMVEGLCETAKNLDEKDIDAQLKAYGEYLDSELEQAEHQVRDLIREYTRQVAHAAVAVQIGDIFSSH